MDRALLQAANQSGDTVAPFFGFIGAASALVFACEWPLITSAWPCVQTPSSLPRSLKAPHCLTSPSLPC